jgi:hypothetical protein
VGAQDEASLLNAAREAFLATVYAGLDFAYIARRDGRSEELEDDGFFAEELKFY